MRPIPQKLRRKISQDRYYDKCIFTGLKPVELHHCYTYAGQQINELWNILPVHYTKHRIDPDAIHNSIDRRNQAKLIALSRANLDELKQNHPKFNWEFEYNKLKKKYEVKPNNQRTPRGEPERYNF